MILFSFIAGVYIISTRAELYDHKGKIGDVMLPIFQYDYYDNLSECSRRARN
jgi:hypothetical protein